MAPLKLYVFMICIQPRFRFYNQFIGHISQLDTTLKCVTAYMALILHVLEQMSALFQIVMAIMYNEDALGK